VQGLRRDIRIEGQGFERRDQAILPEQRLLATFGEGGSIAIQGVY
jgi:hypothetical protein